MTTNISESIPDCGNTGDITDDTDQPIQPEQDLLVTPRQTNTRKIDASQRRNLEGGMRTRTESSYRSVFSTQSLEERRKFNAQYFCFVKSLSRFAFATKPYLCYDANMVLCMGDSRIYHKVRFDKKWYRTVELLSDVSAQETSGRSTRVWLCTDNEGVNCAVKEQWLSNGRVLEHELQVTILGRAVEKIPLGVLEKHFFPILAHEKMMIGSGKDDAQTAVRGLELLEEPEQLEIKIETANVSSESMGDMISLGTAILLIPSSVVKYRIHNHLVPKEVATPVGKVEYFNQVFTALRDGVEGSDRVHRDISAGNADVYEGRGLVGVLDYAKMIGAGYTKDVWTGTSDYMAIEVAKGSYSFLPDDSGDSETDTVEGAEEIHLGEGQEHPDLIFTHVPIHDVESLWWIAILWIFCNKFFKIESPIAEDWDFKNQLEIECGIFPCHHVSRSLERHVFFKEDYEYKKAMRTLHFGLKEILSGLYMIRKRLHRLYKRLERDLIGKNPKLNEEAYRRESLARVKSLFDVCARVSEGMKMERLVHGRNEGVQDWKTDNAEESICETEVLRSSLE